MGSKQKRKLARANAAVLKLAKRLESERVQRIRSDALSDSAAHDRRLAEGSALAAERECSRLRDRIADMKRDLEHGPAPIIVDRSGLAQALSKLPDTRRLIPNRVDDTPPEIIIPVACRSAPKLDDFAEHPASLHSTIPFINVVFQRKVIRDTEDGNRTLIAWMLPAGLVVADFDTGL